MVSSSASLETLFQPRSIGDRRNVSLSSSVELLVGLGAALQNSRQRTQLVNVLEEFSKQITETLFIQMVKETAKRAEAKVSRDAFRLCVDRVAQLFLAIERVSEIRVKAADAQATLHVFAIMPQYDDALMDALIDIEIQGDRAAKELGYQLDYRYYPLPQVNPQNSGLDKLPKYQPS